MKLKAPTAAARKLHAKLSALAERGINGERDAAKLKLEKLVARYDFTQPDRTTVDLFSGVFQRSTNAQPIATLDSGAMDVCSFVKWAIEDRAKIQCLFKDGQLCAEAAPRTAERLKAIAATVTDGFTRLWDEYKASPGSNPLDRAVFLRGIYDGLTGEKLTGPLPARIEEKQSGRAKKKAVGHAAGIRLHPYQVAAHLGEQIRFCAPIEEVSNTLTDTINRGAIPQTTTP